MTSTSQCSRCILCSSQKARHAHRATARQHLDAKAEHNTLATRMIRIRSFLHDQGVEGRERRMSRRRRGGGVIGKGVKGRTQLKPIPTSASNLVFRLRPISSSATVLFEFGKFWEGPVQRGPIVWPRTVAPRVGGPNGEGPQFSRFVFPPKLRTILASRVSSR